MALSIHIMNRTKKQVLIFLLLSFSLTRLSLASNCNILAASAQGESMDEYMTMEHAEEEGEGEIEKLIPSITEWTGVFSLGIFAGLLAFKTNIPSSSKNQNFEKRGRVEISIAILSFSAGIIHLFLVQEHSREAFAWGLFFLISGIAQNRFWYCHPFYKKTIQKSHTKLHRDYGKCLSCNNIHTCKASYTPLFT